MHCLQVSKNVSMNTESLKAHMESMFGPPRTYTPVSRIHSIEESQTSNTGFVNLSFPTIIEVTNSTNNIPG